MNAITTTHKLDFEACPWPLSKLSDMVCEILDAEKNKNYPEIEWIAFRVGSCEGLYRITPEAYEILSIINNKPGNGHLEDVLEWFEYACKRSRLPLRILSFTNAEFKRHLINKKGFKPFGTDDLQKFFTI